MSIYHTRDAIEPFGNNPTTYSVEVSNSTSPATSAGSGFILDSVVTTGTSWNYVGPSSPATLDVNGNANFTGDITFKGQSLSQALDAINERLSILVPDAALEKEFDELRRLGDLYREAEAKFKEQKKIFERLKK